MLQSEEMRKISAESDCLHYGMGWTHEDLSKRQIMIQSSYGESHPGSSHLLELSSSVRDGVLEGGQRPCMFVVSDMCDGIAQGSAGGDYSLPSREYMAHMIEVQARASHCDGLVLLSSCDKAVPAHLIAAARLDKPTILMPGGCMSAGADLRCCDKMWQLRRDAASGRYTTAQLDAMAQTACPTAGACQQFGTAGTMQAMAEALGLALPHTALIPAANNAIKRASRATGQQICRLSALGITARDILTKEAFENAITIHAAVGGSTNAIMHLIAAARAAAVELGAEDFDRIQRRTPYLTNTLSTGAYPTEYFWYAGGVPEVMCRLRDLLHEDVLTVSGRTLGENLDAWEAQRSAFYACDFLKNVHLTPKDVIVEREQPIREDGGIAILKGNIAPKGAVVKHSAVDASMQKISGRVRLFTSEDDAIAACIAGTVRTGHIIVVVGQGPKAKGMPELFRLSDLLAEDKERMVPILTDGRYSGNSRGGAIGYVCPEASIGGPIGKLRDGDVVCIDIPNRSVDLIEGMENGQRLNGEALLRVRALLPLPQRQDAQTGALAIYRSLAQQALDGAGMAL